jgi:hypothetical protein
MHSLRYVNLHKVLLLASKVSVDFLDLLYRLNSLKAAPLAEAMLK